MHRGVEARGRDLAASRDLPDQVLAPEGGELGDPQLELEARGRLRVGDVLGELFARDGVGALLRTLVEERGIRRLLYGADGPHGPVLKAAFAGGKGTTLVGYDETTATYRVVFRQSEKTIADSTVAVSRGGRAVVGGTDGPGAPYLFVVIEPETDRSAEDGIPRAGKDSGLTAPAALGKVPPRYPEEARKPRVHQGILHGNRFDHGADDRDQRNVVAA